MNANKLAFALSSSNRGKILTDEVKAKIDSLVEKETLCKDIFKALKDEVEGLKYQNIRGYLQRQAMKLDKS